MTTPDFIRAHRHSIRHLNEVLSSSKCGCFYCCSIFLPSEIEKWTDEWEGVGQTALCPKCGIDSIVGSQSGYPVTVEFLKQMNSYWF